MNKVGAGFTHSTTIVKDFNDRADKAIQSKQSFGVFGFKLPRPGFMQDKDGIKRIEEAKQRADEMLADLMSSLSKVFERK